MSENISVLRPDGDRLTWLRAGDAVSEDVSDPQVAARLQATLKQRGHAVVFAAPGADIRLQTLPVTPEERRHLSASLPFMLEENLAEEIDHLHFARRELARDRIAVACLRRDCMERWSALLTDWSTLNAWVPEPLLLPWEPGQWTLVCDGDTLLVRHGESEGTAIERSLAPLFLQALAEEAQPQQIVIYGSDEATDRLMLPETLRDKGQWRRGGLGAALLLSDAQAPQLDLRQGDFARRFPYERWWAQWRVAAIVFAVAVALHLLGGWLDLRRLEANNLALRGEIQQVYREVNPRGAVVDAEKQLRRQLDALGGGDVPGFASLLGPLGEAMAAQGNATLASLNYSQSSGELRVNMLAQDFEAVERIRSGLVAMGLNAALESSSRAGERVRARLRIEGRGA